MLTLYAAVGAMGLVVLDPSQAAGRACLEHPGMAVLLGATVALPIALLRITYRRWNLPPGVHYVFKVPSREVEAWMLALLRANLLARAGHVSDGYQYLLAAAQRAEGARDRGEPWGDKLVGHYRRELDHYTRRYGTG